MNKKLLKSYIMKYDEKQENLAKAMGLSLSCLNAKINRKNTEFNRDEIQFIMERYNLSLRDIRDIFFASDVSCKDTKSANE
ncbi:hypothetical protein M2140_001961 [Clostridiales Family XIII bacterium PM5-7]